MGIRQVEDRDFTAPCRNGPFGSLEDRVAPLTGVCPQSDVDARDDQPAGRLRTCIRKTATKMNDADSMWCRRTSPISR
jgi:hypothetical protein